MLKSLIGVNLGGSVSLPADTTPTVVVLAASVVVLYFFFFKLSRQFCYWHQLLRHVIGTQVNQIAVFACWKILMRFIVQSETKVTSPLSESADFGVTDKLLLLLLPLFNFSWTIFISTLLCQNGPRQPAHPPARHWQSDSAGLHQLISSALQEDFSFRRQPHRLHHLHPYHSLNSNKIEGRRRRKSWLKQRHKNESERYIFV